MAKTIRPEFQVHRLNDAGMAKAIKIAEDFSALLIAAEETCGSGGREMALVRTHLEQAAFYAKRAMASKEENQAEA